MPAREIPYGAKVAMEPVDYELAYRVSGAKDDVKLAGAVLRPDWAVSEGADAFPLRVRAVFDGEVLKLDAEVLEDGRVQSVRVVLRHAFASEEMVLLNGYQSWTDTSEELPWSRMRGLQGVSSRLIKRFSLDAGGDYSQVDYQPIRGLRHGFTYATFRRGDGMVLVGSLDESRGFTVVKTNPAKGRVVLEPECPARPLKAGEHIVLGSFAVTRGTMRQCYDRWFQLMDVHARPVKPLVGYSSWYRHYGAIDEASLESDLAGMESFIGKEVRLSLDSAQKLFQIDDGYCRVGDWLDVDRVKFPNGLAPLASRIRDAGYMPGLWAAPFVCEKESKLFRERSEWLLRDESGDPVPTGSQWSGGFALDTRNVEVRSYVLETLQTMTRDWGFGLLKLDFLYAACMLPHDGLNRGELMADAVSLLRRGVGENVLILGCGVPLASAFGAFDYCRIGCDVGLDWDDVPHMRLLHRERVSTKNSLGNTYSRAPLDGRAFGNDPDVFFLRRDVKLTDAQRDELLFADADLGSVFLTSDDMGQWDVEMRDRYLEALKIVLERHAGNAD